MLSVEKLAALDLSVWLRSGHEAATRLRVTQPNVSRRVRQALQRFELQLMKRDEEWELEGSALGQELLGMERQVHQMARWMGHAPLRIEGTYWSGPLLLSPEPQGWVVGCCNVVGIEKPLRWLRQGVIDAWLAGGPDWPEPDDPEFTVIALCHMPLHVVVAPGHPLLRELGLWNSPSRMHRYRRSLWEGKSEQELAVGYATVLSEQVAGALVLRRPWAEHPAIATLTALLHQRLQPLAVRHPELVLVS